MSQPAVSNQARAWKDGELKCALCNGTANAGEFCKRHTMAYENIRRSFTAWKRALDIDWVTYLEGVSPNPKTGQWAIEVCQYLLTMGNGNPIRHEEGK